MPSSKSKKQSKGASAAASKLSQSHSDADQTATSPWTPKPGPELSQDELLQTLNEASSKYPALIGKSAVIARVVEDVKQESKGCRIWLSEMSMVAYSISPGSLVSVSLAVSRKCISSHTPLSSLVDECARHFLFSFNEKMVHDVGTYFALATVFPSCKLSKDEVGFSSNLSCAMGYPAAGRITFVYPIDSQLKMSSENGNAKLHQAALNPLSFCYCKDLHLALLFSGKGVTNNSVTLAHIDSLSGKNRGQVENGNISSPKTPSLSQSMINSSSSCQLTSPRYADSVSNSYDQFQTTFDAVDIREVLQDESGKKLLQTCTSLLLYSRHILCGNIVTIPILSKLCTFQVVGASKISEDSSVHSMGENNYDFLQTPVSHVNDVFLVDRRTKVHLFLSSSSDLETPQKQGLMLEFESEDAKADSRVDFSNLGGLSKEYAVLKDIIISSSVRGTLSRYVIERLVDMLFCKWSWSFISQKER